MGIVHVVYANSPGEVEKAKAIKNLNKSSFIITPAIEYAMNMLRRPMHSQYRNITHLISKPVVCEMAERRNCIELEYDAG